MWEEFIHANQLPAWKKVLHFMALFICLADAFIPGLFKAWQQTCKKAVQKHKHNGKHQVLIFRQCCVNSSSIYYITKTLQINSFRLNAHCLSNTHKCATQLSHSCYCSLVKVHQSEVKCIWEWYGNTTNWGGWCFFPFYKLFLCSLLNTHVHIHL